MLKFLDLIKSCYLFRNTSIYFFNKLKNSFNIDIKILRISKLYFFFNNSNFFNIGLNNLVQLKMQIVNRDGYI